MWILGNREIRENDKKKELRNKTTTKWPVRGRAKIKD
jgi:hypothetical protein